MALISANSPVYNLCDSLDWEEVLSDDECSDTLAYAKIAYLTQLLAQRDVELAQKDAELDRKDAEISLLSQKNAELAQKNTELIQKNTELSQLLSRRDEESAQNVKVLNDIKQELLSVKQELAQRDAELVQERMCLRDRTLPAPIDVQVKLDEMFKSWNNVGGHIYAYLLPPLLPKIRAATEQIKEPIMGLFHVTYSEYSSFKYMYSDAMLFTATDVYYLTNSEYNSPSHDTRKVILEDTSGVFMQNSVWRSRYTFTDPKWVKWTAINKDANFKKIITYIYHSGYTGIDYPARNSTLGNIDAVVTGSQTASARLQQLLAVAL
jgi:hypothetical protein